MTIHVNIGEAKTRLSALISAAVMGEEVVVAKSGAPQVRLVPVASCASEEEIRIAERRARAIGMFDKESESLDLSLRALKSDRTDPDERYRLKFDSTD